MQRPGWRVRAVARSISRGGIRSTRGPTRGRQGCCSGFGFSGASSGCSTGWSRPADPHHHDALPNSASPPGFFPSGRNHSANLNVLYDAQTERTTVIAPPAMKRASHNRRHGLGPGPRNGRGLFFRPEPQQPTTAKTRALIAEPTTAESCAPSIRASAFTGRGFSVHYPTQQGAPVLNPAFADA
jgi:hypothetical protein